MPLVHSNRSMSSKFYTQLCTVVSCTLFYCSVHNAILVESSRRTLYSTAYVAVFERVSEAVSVSKMYRIYWASTLSYYSPGVSYHNHDAVNTC